MGYSSEPHDEDSSDPDVGLDEDEYDSMIENGTDESESEIESIEPENAFKMKKRKIEDIEVTVPKKKSKTDKELHKPPTVEELNQLRETENLFHSNLFRLQIEEMLQQIKIKDKYKIMFGNWLENLKYRINQIEETDEFAVCRSVG